MKKFEEKGVSRGPLQIQELFLKQHLPIVPQD